MSPAWLSLRPSMVLGQILALSTEAAWRPKLWILKLASNPISGDRPREESMGETHPTQEKHFHIIKAAGPERTWCPRRHLNLQCPQPSLPLCQRASLTSHRAIFHDGALAPGKRILEGLKEVKDAPADDDVVIETNKKTDLGGRRRTWY